MGLDIYLYSSTTVMVDCICHTCDNVHKKEETEIYFEENITHNLAKMAAACGLYEVMWTPDENSIKTGKDAIPYLISGLTDLLYCPGVYKEYEPSNHFGDYEDLLSTAELFLEACKKHPEGIIKASR
jgi:hypothetical protein